MTNKTFTTACRLLGLALICFTWSCQQSNHSKSSQIRNAGADDSSELESDSPKNAEDDQETKRSSSSPEGSESEDASEAKTPKGTSKKTIDFEASKAAQDTLTFSKLFSITPDQGSIKIDAILVNQAVAKTIYQSNRETAASGSEVPILPGRPALFQFGWDGKPEDGQTYSLMLAIKKNGASEVKIFKDDKQLSGASNLNSTKASWAIEINADYMNAEASWAAIIIDSDQNVIDRYPPIGSESNPAFASMPIDSKAIALKLMIIQINTTCGKFGKTWTEKNRTDYENWLYSVLPISSLKVEYASTPIDIDTPCAEIKENQILNAVSKRRSQEVASKGPEWFYQGVMTASSNPFHKSGLAGLANIGNGKKTSDRSSWISWMSHHPGDVSAHELGHNFGRMHAFNDPNFMPKEGQKCGARLEVGYGVKASTLPQCAKKSSQILYPIVDQCQKAGYPSCTSSKYYDFMSYTYPFWVGSHTYRNIHQTLDKINTWSSGLSLGEPGAPGYVAFIVGDEIVNFRSQRVETSDEQGQAVAEFDQGSRVPIRVIFNSDMNPTAIQMAKADLPEELLNRSFTVVINGRSYQGSAR